MARALLARPGHTLDALPGGELRPDPYAGPDQVSKRRGRREVTIWALSGTGPLNPSYFVMEGDAFFGTISPSFAVLAEGFEGEDERLRELAAEFGCAPV